MAKRARTRTRTDGPTTPLTAQRVQRLKALRPAGKPPQRIELTLGQIRLPRGSRANLVRVRGAEDLYRVNVAVRGSDLGRRFEPGPIPTERIDRSRVKPGTLSQLELHGYRLDYLRVDHLPGKIALRRSDVRYPPVFRKLKRGLDRPTNVFPPDQRYI